MFTLGSLCTGSAALDLAIMEMLPARLAFVADNAPASVKLLAHHYPDVPNLGDITRTAWDVLPAVDILSAGFPCQPVSVAGKKRGEADERWIWPGVAHAVRVLRPGLVILENVAAILGRGAGRVIGDLAALGYVGSYVCMPATAAGAPHRRNRWFAVAYPAGGGWPGAAGHLDQAQREARGGQAERLQRYPPGDSGLDAGFRWGDHAPAIRHWEHVTGYPAPWPVGPDGWMDQAFPEWMMGLPPGWVTGVPGLTAADQRGLLGNGVVPQHARLAIASLAAERESYPPCPAVGSTEGSLGGGPGPGGSGGGPGPRLGG